VTIALLQFLHATHFSRPAEQTKIIRIAHLIPAYSLISWFCIFFPQAYYYLNPWLELVQSICMATFFLLLLEFISPNEDQRSLFFAGIEIKDKKDKKAPSGRHYDSPEKNLMWYRRKWVAIFQYPVVSLIVAVVTDITEAIGDYCDISFAPHFAHLWMFILSNLSVTVAVTSIFMMYKALRVHLKHHNPLAKLGAFKLVVGLGFLQGIIFSILQSTHAIGPTATLTYADIKVGIPTMLTCIEMVPIALFFHFAYSHRPYCLDGKRQPVPVAESAVAAPTPITSYQGGFLGHRAILLAIDPREVLQAVLFAFKMGTELKRHQNQMDDGYSDSMEPLREQTAYKTGPQYGQVGVVDYPPQPYGYQGGHDQQPGYGQQHGYNQQGYNGRPSYNA
jgi:Organic solute transporter Ostalpha